MTRVLCIDYGEVRVGLAWSDSTRRIAFPLCVLPKAQVLAYLKDLLVRESISAIVLGLPLGLRGEVTDITSQVYAFCALLKRHFPDIVFHLEDERYTSKIAEAALVAMHSKGKLKRQRLRKSALDASSASLILQSYLARQTL